MPTKPRSNHVHPAFFVAVFAVAILLIPDAAHAARPLYGANVHPWSDFYGSVDYVAASLPGGIVRWDEQVPGLDAASAVGRYDYVRSKGLKADIVLVQACCDYNATFIAVRNLAVAMGEHRQPIVEITNEPNAVGFGDPWPASAYQQTLYSARNGLQQSGYTNLRLSMGGLAMNDQSYLSAAVKPIAWATDFANAHLYTSGGNPHIGPFAPDDTDVAHNGFFSFSTGVEQMQSGLNKPLIVGEWGYTGIDPYQRAAYMRATVSIARARGVYALIVEEIGSGDGPDLDLRGTTAWNAFVEAAKQ